MASNGIVPASSASDPAVDCVALSKLIGTAPATFGALLAVCDRDFPSTLGRLRDAISAREQGQSSQAAHAMKGMLLNLCAAEASRLAREIEQLIILADYDAALSRMEPLGEELERIRQELRAASRG